MPLFKVLVLLEENASFIPDSASKGFSEIDGKCVDAKNLAWIC